MKRSFVETLVGALVLAVAGGFFYFVYNGSGIKQVEGYSISANFDDASGILGGSEVKIGGVNVGVVESMDINKETFQAIVVMNVTNEIKLPKDSTASITSSGLLGGKFVKIEPGGDEQNIADGGKIKFTQSSVSIEEMIGKFMFSGGGVGADEAKKDDSSAAGNSLGLDLE